MRKSLNSGIVKFGIAVLALSLNLFAACEIGLGSAVDTEVPEIDFADTTVASGAVVRDSFAVFGTFDDDGSISSLAATLTNLETGYVVDKDGEIDMENKTWTVVFDPKEDSIPDATYELSIVIKDSVDHESKISRSIIIDNTAPLVVLSRPSTKKGAANFDSYGQSFTLEGKAADDNDVSLIEVAVYDNPNCTGSPLKTIELPNVPLTIESDVATYAANTVNDYSVIYGHVDTSGFVIRDGTDATRYCKVIVYDGAQRYPADGSAQTDADKKGNSVNYYYLNSDLAELFTAGYKITELYHILNGTYEGTTSRSIGTSNVISTLQNTQKQTNIGQFKLNPENSPHFVVSSRNTMNYAAGEALEDHSMTNGNSFIEVEITPGLDGHIIKEETIGVYLLRCRLKTAAEAAATGPGIVYLNSAGNVADDVDGNRIWLIPVNQHTQTADITQSGSTYKFKTKTSISTTNFTALDIGQGYVIKVTGEDMQGNDIVSDGDFCFSLTTSGTNIDITTASVNPLWISTNTAAKTQNQNPSVILKYSSENQYTNDATHPFQIWRGETATTLERIDNTISTSITSISGAQATTTDSSLISGLNISSSHKPATVYYKIKGDNSAETITPKPVALQYDDANPTVSIPPADLPSADAGEQSSITFRGNASDADSGINKVYVQIYDKDHSIETTPAAPAVGATPASNVLTATYSGGTWVLPVTPAQHDGGTNEDSAFAREGGKIILVTVEDAVGLRATTQASDGEFIYDKTKPTGTITGTVPAISSSVLNISGTASDGWGVAKVEIEQKKKNSSGVFVNPIKRTVWEEASNATTPSPSVTWSTANPVIPSEPSAQARTLPFSSSTASYTQTQMDGTGHPADGEYEYTITVTDKAGKTNTTSITKQISFYSVAPEITFTQPTGAFALTDSASTTPWQTTSNTINVSGTASVNSGATITGVYYKLLADTSSAPTSYTGTGWTLAGQSNWSISESISDGVEKHLYVVAVDNANKQSAVYHKVIKVDTTAPTTTAVYYEKDGGAIQTTSGTVYVKNGTSLTIYGSYADAASGVQELTFGGFTPASVQYSTNILTTNSSGTAVTTIGFGTYSADSSTSYKTWKAVLNFTASSTGGTLTATGTNGADLTTPVTVLNIQVDTDPPEVTITSPATNTFIGNTALTISGSANDGTGSGLSSEAFTVYYTKSSSLGGVTTAPTSLTTGTNAASAWVQLGTATSGATWTYPITQANIASLTTTNANTPLWFTVAVKDKAGSGNIAYALPVKVTVDRKLPSYTESATQIGGKTTAQLASSPWFSQATLAVSGTYTDDGSGVDLIYYQLGSATPVPVPTNDGTFTTNISGFTEGTTGTVLKLKAKDKAGNTTSESSYTVKVDTSDTTLSANCYKKGSAATLYPATGTAYLKNTTTALTVYGKYENNVSGVQPLTFKYGNSTFTPTSVQYSTSDLTISSGTVTAVPADSAYGAYSAASATSYKTWKAVFTPTANGRLTVEGSNNAGVPVTATAFEVTIDTENPSLENIKLKETTGSGTNAVTKEAYIRESNSTYYVNNSSAAGKAFKVTGVATDNYGVEKVSFSVVRWANGAATSDTLTVADITNPSGAWEKAITGWESWTDSAVITVTATDKAGRTISSTINVSFDRAAPKPMHWADAKGKDIYFRIGNADNDKTDATHWETGDDVGDGTSDADVANSDVGSKYSYGSWGSDSSIEIRGTFEEASTGSGIKTIYYAIFDNATALTNNNLTAFTNGTLSADATNHIIKVGSFAPLDTAVTKNVPYNKDSSGTKDKKEISTNFRTTLSGFNAEENFLVLLAEDYAGNRALDELKVTEGTTNGSNNGTAITTGTNTWNSSKAYYGIKKDSQTPDIATSVTTGLYTNGAGADLTINGTASDLLSGLKNVVVTIEEIMFSEPYSGFVAGSAIQSWSVTVPASAFASMDSGSYTAYAEATDRAGSGNKKKISAATIYVDKTPPTVTINSPVEDAKVGAAFTISGTARDGTGAGVNTAATAKPVLYYTTSSTVGANAPTATTIGTNAASSWKVYGNPTLANEQDWSLNVDLSAIVSANANTPVYLSVSATDKSGSGNTGYSSPRLVTVDTKAPQKSAFNIGTTTEASINTTWFNNNTLNINGNFTDDGTTGSGVAAIIYKLDNGSEQEIPSTGTFDRPVAGFTDTTSATPHILQVRAKDAVGNLSAWVPYSVKVDTARPVISAVTGHPFTETTLTNGSAARTFYFDALDTGSGITVSPDSVTVQISNSENNTTAITNGQHGSSIIVGAADATTGKHLVTVVLGAADLASLSGSNSVLVSVSDTAGNQSNLQSIGTLNVDTDAPVPSFTSHNNTATVNKTITLAGTVTDASNSAITAMSLTITYGSQTKVYGYPTGADGNITYSNGQWSYTLDTTALYNGTATQAMSLALTATDAAGNTGTADIDTTNSTANEPLTLTIDQNSDRPVVKFTNLIREGSGTNTSPYKYILKYGTEAQLEGTVTDDDSTSSTVVQVFKASSNPITSATAAVSGTTTFNEATGEFTFKPENTNDGSKTVYFYIKDNKNNEFYTTYTTGTTAQLGRPYQQYKTSAKEDNASGFNYSSDSNAPTISSIQLQAWNHATETAASYKTGQATSLGSNCIVGGPLKRYIDISTSVTDDNGIKGIVLILEQTGKPTKYYRSNASVSEAGVASDGYVETASISATTTSAAYTYKISRLDVSDYDEGEVDVTIKVYDQSGLYANQQSMFVVDNTAPVLTIENFADGDVVYGIKKNTVGGTISGATDVEGIYYAVTKDAVNNVAVESSSIADTDWILVTGQKISAKIIFGGTNADSAIGQIGDSLRQWLMTIYEHDNTWMLEHDDNLGLAVHFKAIDACGNTGYSKRVLEVVPNGDKPTITLTYPVDLTVNNVTTNPSLAGTIRVYGNAEVAEGNVAAVYVQIDTNYNSTTGFNASGWETGFNSCISGKGTSYTVEQIGNRTDLRGVKATGTLNWNLPINGNKEFNPEGSSRPMAIRIYGVGGSGKVSEYVEQVFTVDPNAPHIGGDGTYSSVMQLKLVQLNNSGAITKQMPYKSGAWVTGQWYIAASVYDDSGIRLITLDQNDGYAKIKIVDGTVKQTAYTRKDQANYQPIIVNDNDCHEAINNVTGKKNFDIYIPLPTTEGSGSVNFTIEAVEVAENANSSTENIKINYDNTPPKLGTIGHENYNANAYNVRQDDGFYRIFGYATDTDGGNLVSDLKAVAFYFVRRGSANTRVYDPMWKDKPVAIQTGTTNTTGISYEYGMFWNTKTVGRVADLSKLTLTTSDDNIHAGGFVLIEGTIYTIREVSPDGKTITLKTEAPAGITTAKFAYAMVIDNFDMTESIDDRDKITTTSAYGYGYYEPDSTADDGDLMQEKWANGKWEAWINSANIPDGPIEIHYVALDNAQNYSVGIVGNLSLTEYQAKTTLDVSANGTPATASGNLISGFDYIYDANKKAYVSNNAPRLAGVTVGTDYNGNGTVEANEKKTKYVAQKNVLFSGTSTEVAGDVTDLFIASSDNTSSGTAMMALKGNSSVEAEIIGGNGNIYYQYSIDGTTYKDHATIAAIAANQAGAFTKNNTAMSITRDTEGLANDADYGATYYKSTTLPAITFTEAQIKSAVASNNDKTWFTFEFWDSTEETTKFENSQYAQLKLPLSIQVYDTTDPNTFINDLYWNSSTDNSVYTNPATDKLEGHIELKDYLGAGFTAENYGTDDDKISGKVVFRGYAYDNKRLKSLNWGIKNALTGTILQAWPQTYITAVQYNPETGSWGVPTTSNGTTTWTTTGDSGDSSIGLPYYYFKVYDDEAHGAYLNENGHKVYWELTIDTSHVQEPGEISDDAWAVGKNLYVYVQATDNADRTTDMNPTVVTTGTDAQKLKPNYKVDVVPYITGIKSRLSDNRSSNGRYQIADTETGVELIGYNLKVGSANLAIDTLPTASGAYSTEIHGCVTINNLNNNAAVGNITDATEAAKVRNKYNYQPSSYNNSLTDDVYIQLWQFNNRAAQTNTSYGFIQEPVMKFNPSNGILGFAFSNGANKFSMAFGRNNSNTEQTSYTLWEYNYASYVRNALAFDERGTSHGISVGIDTEPSSGKSGRMNYFYSRWGRSAYNDRAGNFSNNTNSNHIECIGIPNGNNLSSNTPPEGGWDGGAGNCIIMEQRFKSVSMVATTKGETNNTATPRVYIAFYDDIREQITFKYGEVGTTARNTYGQIQSSGNPNGGDGRAFSVSGDYWSVIADGGSATPYKPGEYLDIAVKPGTSLATDVVCVVWFDATNSKLMYSYKVGPNTDNDASTLTGTYTNGYWSNAVTLKQNCGEYCKIAIDANGGVHITAYDRGNKGVGYVYLPTYNSTYSEATNYFLIDAVNGPYDELGIDVAVDGTDNTGKAYPTISYYANGTPKMATYSTGITKTIGMPEAAWENDSFTGKWDVCFVPTASNLLKDHINVAQPKNDTGIRNAVATTSKFTASGDADSGTVTGNLTTNPILGYAIREGSKGYMEIAQRK